jgi:hypothetical protein
MGPGVGERGVAGAERLGAGAGDGGDDAGAVGFAGERGARDRRTTAAPGLGAPVYPSGVGCPREARRGQGPPDPAVYEGSLPPGRVGDDRAGDAAVRVLGDPVPRRPCVPAPPTTRCGPSSARGARWSAREAIRQYLLDDSFEATPSGTFVRYFLIVARDGEGNLLGVRDGSVLVNPGYAPRPVPRVPVAHLHVPAGARHRVVVLAAHRARRHRGAVPRRPALPRADPAPGPQRAAEVLRHAVGSGGRDGVLLARRPHLVAADPVLRAAAGSTRSTPATSRTCSPTSASPTRSGAPGTARCRS